MEQIILNHFQQTVLALFKKTPLAKKYYLSGGTALAEFYLHHRKSEDLDFFTQEELDLEELKKFVQLSRGGVKHKIDFGQYPFNTIAFRPRLRDFIDLYCILEQEKSWRFSQLLQVKKLKDMPMMIKKINLKSIEAFFLNKAKKLEKKIWR